MKNILNIILSTFLVILKIATPSFANINSADLQTQIINSDTYHTSGAMFVITQEQIKIGENVKETLNIRAPHTVHYTQNHNNANYTPTNNSIYKNKTQNNGVTFASIINKNEKKEVKSIPFFTTTNN